MSIYIIALGTGIVSFLSPCIIPMITVYFSLITGMSANELETAAPKGRFRIKIILHTLLFILGFTIIFTLFGAASGTIAGFIKEYTSILNVIGGIFVILLSLKLLGLFKNITLSNAALDDWFENFKEKAVTGYHTTFLVGVFFAITCSHCLGPLLYSTLIFAGNTGSVSSGMAVMFFFSIGLGIPYLLIGFSFGSSVWLIKKLQKYQTAISFITGIILLFMGILLLLNKFTVLVELLYKIIPISLPIGM